MMKRIFLFLLLLFIGIQLDATTFYISPSGSDGNSGSFYLPWKTLSHACTQVKTIGDIIHIETGTYYETVTSKLAVGVNINGEGLSSILTTTSLLLPIITLESPNGTISNQIISNIKIDGGSIAHSAINIKGRSGVNINNCMFSNFRTCIELRNTCVYAIYGENVSNIEIHHNTIQGTVNLFYTSNIDIHHNTIGYPVMNLDFKDGVYTCDVDNFIVRNNYFKNLATQVTISSYANTKLQNIFIYNNVMFNIGVASDEWYGSGIDFGGLTTEPAHNIVVANNTMIANPQNRNTRIGIYLPTVGYATDIFIQNNIMTGFRYATIFAAGPERTIDVIHIENNIFWDNTTDVTKTYCTSDSAYYTNIALPLNELSNYMFTDPLFMSNNDFHLNQFSPAVRSGIYIPTITTDYEDNKRTTTFDIGAYGYGLTTAIEEQELEFLIYPVPFTDHFTIVADSPNFRNLRIDVCNIQGVIIYQKKLTDVITNVYLYNAKSGLYIVRFLGSYGEIISTTKVIKY
jgi:hypothetical protein